MALQERLPQLLDGWLPVSWVVLMVWLVFVDLVVPVVFGRVTLVGVSSCRNSVRVGGRYVLGMVVTL